MIIVRREITLGNVEDIKDKFQWNAGLKNFRYFKQGKSVVTSLYKSEFRTHIVRNSPLLYIPPNTLSDSEIIIQSDRLIIKANNEQEGNETLDNFLLKYPEVFGKPLEEDLLELIKKDEDIRLEFKSTLRYDIETDGVIPSSAMEYSSLKTIAAFLNTDGGNLIIGISDDRTIIGLSYDYETLENKNRDGFELQLINQITSKIGYEYIPYIKITFHPIDDKEICKISVAPSHEPIYLQRGNTQEFYIRLNNSSRPLPIAEVTKYIKRRWG